MATQIRVLFRVNADVALGLGHLSRCHALMLALSRLVACRFAVVTHNKDAVRRVMSSIDFELYEVGDKIQGGCFDIVVVDIPNPSRAEENFRDITNLLVCLDDSGAGLYDQDVLIRPNLLGLPRPAELAEGQYWIGQVILHPDFAMPYPIPLTVEKLPGVKEIFVCFGGSDPCGITLRVVSTLKNLSGGVQIRIVLGAAFQWDEELALLLDMDTRFIVMRNIPDVARVLQMADVALISGGTLLYEACASGIPSVVICQNEEQQMEADAAHGAGAVISLGTNANVLDKSILLAIEQLLSDADLRQKMARQGLSLVVPDGAAGLATRLLSRLRKREEE